MGANCRFAFAVHVLAMLATRSHGVTSSTLAASVNTNPVVIRRILCSLRHAGVIRTRKGAGAGSVLSRPPAEIGLDLIYRATTQDTAFSFHPHSPDQKCVVGRNIERVLGEVFHSAQSALEDALARRTLADVLKTVGGQQGEGRVSSAGSL